MLRDTKVRPGSKVKLFNYSLILGSVVMKRESANSVVRENQDLLQVNSDVPIHHHTFVIIRPILVTFDLQQIQKCK